MELPPAVEESRHPVGDSVLPRSPEGSTSKAVYDESHHLNKRAPSEDQDEGPDQEAKQQSPGWDVRLQRG